MESFFFFFFLHTYMVYSSCIVVYLKEYNFVQNKILMGFKIWSSWGVGHFIFKITLFRTVFVFLSLKLVFALVIVVWVKYLCFFLKREKKKYKNSKKKKIQNQNIKRKREKRKMEMKKKKKNEKKEGPINLSAPLVAKYLQPSPTSLTYRPKKSSFKTRECQPSPN